MKQEAHAGPERAVPLVQHSTWMVPAHEDVSCEMRSLQPPGSCPTSLRHSSLQGVQTHKHAHTPSLRKHLPSSAAPSEQKQQQQQQQRDTPNKHCTCCHSIGCFHSTTHGQSGWMSVRDRAALSCSNLAVPPTPNTHPPTQTPATQNKPYHPTREPCQQHQHPREGGSNLTTMLTPTACRLVHDQRQSGKILVVWTACAAALPARPCLRTTSCCHAYAAWSQN